MSARLKFWLSFAQLTLLFILAASLFMLTTLIGPMIETRFAPVVDKLVMAELTEDDKGRSRFNAEFVKLRACEYLGLGWYDTLTNSRVTTVLERTTNDTDGATRPPGFTRTGPWTVYLSNADLLDHSKALLFHRCHPFWVSVTEFWP